MRVPCLIVPVLTPFDPGSLAINYSALQREVEYVLAQSPSAVVGVASVETQEYQYLSNAQRLELIRRTVEFVNRRAPVFVGISHPDYRQAIEFAHLAEDLGADAVQALAPRRPFGGATTLDDVVAYYQSILSETRLPLCVYNNPGPGVEVLTAWMIELAQIDRVEYFKDSSRDISRVALLIERIDRAGHARYFATVESLLTVLMHGGSGATMPPPASTIAQRILDAYTANDFDGARRAASALRLFPATWMHRGVVAVMKASMRFAGVDLGDPYPPYKPLTSFEQAALQQHLASALSLGVAAPEVARVQQ